MTKLSNLLVNKNVIYKNQVGYTSLFEKDFMAFPNRINHDVNAHTFELSITKGVGSTKKWNAHQDQSIEQVAYYSPKDQTDPSKVIAKVEFEGWRRYVAERRPIEGGRIIFHVRGLQKQSTLARAIDDQSFREIGWMEPIVAVMEDPILAINFRETAIEDNPDYIDDLFSRIHRVEMLPHEIMIDLKNVIALNSIDRFKKRMIESGFSEYEFEEALKSIRPTALKGVASPFYVAALFCRTKGKFKEARRLLKKIGKNHWQYTEASDLERSLYEQEIRENKQKYERIIQALKTEVVHLRSRGSIADHTSGTGSSLQLKDTAIAQQDFTIKIQQKAETLKKTNAEHTQRLTETSPSLAKEIIPYFQGLQGLLSQRHNATQTENTPKKRKRQRVT